MNESDLILLRQAGFDHDTILVLRHLGYALAAYDAVTELAEFFISQPLAPEPHGFTVHRQDRACHIGRAIFSAGKFFHQKQTNDALRSVFSAAGLQLK